MTTEILIREKSKQVLQYLEKGNLESARQAIFNQHEILSYNFGLVDFVSLIPKVRNSKNIRKNNDALKVVIDCGFEIFSKGENIDELLFFAAAKCDLDKLKFSVKKILEVDAKNINQVREGDNALVFLIKYGSLGHEDCPKCVKCLIQAGIDVTREDYFSNSPLGLLVNLYEKFSNRKKKNDAVLKNLQNCIELLLDTKFIDLDLTKSDNSSLSVRNLLEELRFNQNILTYQVETNTSEDDVARLFKLLLSGEKEAFQKSVKKHLNADDGNNTFLQLCCEKNLKDTASFLIKNGADLTKTTNRNHQTPLEIAARRDHGEIFDDLLTTNKIPIDAQLFMTFVLKRPKHIKARYLDELLKYKHLNPNLKLNNGNTPLYYAITFSNTEAISVLLQRGASLTAENDKGKCPLDYINAEDLENQLNKCIILDNYTDINNGKYNIALNFQNIIEKDDQGIKSEITVVEKISNSEKLAHLLKHPLISSFIDIKWNLVKSLFKKLFFFNLFFYTTIVLSIINLNPFTYYFGLILSLLYSVKIAFFFNWEGNKLHETVDLAMITTIILFLMQSNLILAILVTVLMVCSLHLYWRFEPRFSHFYSVLIFTLSNFFIYLLYVLILAIFGGVICYIFSLMHNNEGNTAKHHSKNLLHSVLILLPQFYIPQICFFGVFASVVTIMIITNFEYFQKKVRTKISQFEIMSKTNVLIFLKSVEQFYIRFGVFIQSPLIFEKNEGGIQRLVKKEKRKTKNVNNFIINYLVNLNKFTWARLSTMMLSDDNVIAVKNKIKNNCE
ncbi:transient receptor potential cation channel protein painless-like [Tribolium madens]|uniref:transient receptor potential cation channel protein painless-like n=1 Tax=Tribolium madens TaxID=41895 RepID=UPI001CF730DE|nr:transient receptor potential cation channel protein painless-like [Tribolium madens]